MYIFFSNKPHILRCVAQSIECHVKEVIRDPIEDLEVDTFCVGSFILHKLITITRHASTSILVITIDSLVMSKVDLNLVNIQRRNKSLTAKWVHTYFDQT